MLEVRVPASGRAALNVAGSAGDPPQAQAAGECRTGRYPSAAAVRSRQHRTGATEPGFLMWVCCWGGCRTQETIPLGPSL